MPEDFKEKFPSTRVVIDFTEIKCQMPNSLLFNNELFSSYKNHATLKRLVGIRPGGAISFVSQLYSGSISDREIVTRSGFLDMEFANGDSIAPDKGFTIEELLLVSYLYTSVAKALHRHRKNGGSIPAGRPIVDSVFSNFSSLNLSCKL